MVKPATGAVSIIDVARLAGVSRSTVSRVLAESGPTSTIARERVHEAVTALGYTPNMMARALASGAGHRVVVGVVGPARDVLDDPYVGRVLGGAAAVCDQHGIGVSLQWLPLFARDPWGPLAVDRGVRGVVVVNAGEELLAAIPPVLRGRVASIGTVSPGVPAFEVDTMVTAHNAAAYLYASGRRRIAMVSGPGWHTCARRQRLAFVDALAARGLPAHTVVADFTAAGGRVGAAEVLRQWPQTDAIFATCDATALGVIAALRELGVQVPGDIAVAGFDDIPLAALSFPSLTTASHPVEEMAAAATRAVLDPSSVASLRTVFPSHVVRRQSA